jgi:hypothetical protein
VADEVSQNDARRPFKWTAPKRQAVDLLASDELPDALVADAVSVGRATLTRWKAHPEFAAAVQEAVAALGEVARRYAVGRRAARVKALDGRWRDLDGCRRRVLDALAPAEGRPAEPPDPAMLSHARELSRELREHEKQAAQELGQWAEKHVVEGPHGESPFPPWEDLVRLPREELLRLYEERRRLAEGKP